MHVSRIVAVIAGLVLVVVTGTAAYMGFRADARQRSVASDDVRRAALQSLTAELDDLATTTRQLGSLFEASDEVSPSEFRTFTLPMLRTGSASSFAWVPHVLDRDRAAWERRHGVRILIRGGHGDVPAPRMESYDPALLIESTTATVPVGIDVAVSAVRERTLRQAAALHEPVATPVTILLATGKPGILVYAPVYAADGDLRGSAVGTFQVAQLTQSMAAVLPAGAGFELGQDGRVVGRHGALEGDVDHWSVSVAGQRWDVVSSPAPSGRIGSGVIALVVGGLMTALVLLTLSKLARDAGRAERKASQSEERFAHAFDAAPVGMALLDASARHVKVNDALARLLGHTRSSLTGLGAEDIMPPDEAAACRRLVHALLRGDQASFRGDTTVLTRDGRRLRLSVHMTLLDRASGDDAPILVHAVDVTEQRLAERRMKHLADHDPLTGLLNRRGFAAALQSQVAHARRYGAEGALLILDLDGFKGVNDALGHDVGDRLLVDVSEVLRGCLRETDVLARLGGDEFAVILPRETLDEAGIVASKITACLRAAGLGRSGADLPGVTVSVGVAPFAEEFTEGEDVLRAADLAMYSAKAAGRDRHAVHGRHADLV